MGSQRLGMNKREEEGSAAGTQATTGRVRDNKTALGSTWIIRAVEEGRTRIRDASAALISRASPLPLRTPSPNRHASHLSTHHTIISASAHLLTQPVLFLRCINLASPAVRVRRDLAYLADHLAFLDVRRDISDVDMNARLCCTCILQRKPSMIGFVDDGDAASVEPTSGLRCSLRPRSRPAGTLLSFVVACQHSVVSSADSW